MRKVSLWGYTIFENGKIVGLQGKEIKQGKQIKVKWGNTGKSKMVSYARFVYYAFNYKNFNFNDKTIVIKHKNGDEKDCSINNLATINRKYITATMDYNVYKYYSPLYERFLMMDIAISAMSDMITSFNEFFINREIFDMRTAQYFFEAYGVDFYEEIPLRYQKRMIRALNKLTSSVSQQN